MINSEVSPTELLKLILANLREPGLLNDHPWARAMNSVGKQGAGTQSPGELLVQVLTNVFRKMVPSSPPRRGKRLDTRWGIFGILAAQHFAPYMLGRPFPTSLREAWDSMDRSVLFFVYGRTDGLSDEELARFCFAGNEREPAPNSTLSDWHRKGLEQLAEMMILEQGRMSAQTKPASAIRRLIKPLGSGLAAILLILVAFLGWKAWGFYQRVLVLDQKVKALETYLTSSPQLEQIPKIAVKVHDLRLDLDVLHNDAEPYLWLTPHFSWVPKYGGDLSQAEDLLALARNLTTAADEGLSAITPAINMALKNKQPLDVMDLVLQLQEASPQLLNAQVALAQAQAAREQIDTERISPRIKNIVIERIDPLFQTIAGTFPMEDALTMVRIAPVLLGSGKAGPQTYLILIQNEDELRPTGGFLTAAGSAVLKDGRLISINIEAAELVDDLTKPYPIPPWQFEQFMNIEMLLFRDSNWFTDFPTTVSWAEYFYSYTRASSADGVIAIDAHVIVRLLETLGPVHVEGVRYPITDKNVLEYMRSAKEDRPPGVTGEWDRKQFIGRLAEPLLQKILQARGQTWTQLAPVLMDLLDERHILLQFDDQDAAKLLERRNWDGAVRIPPNSDFLMVVDTNMGYNKSNAVMDMALEYIVDLSNITGLLSRLIVHQTNHSKVDVPCEPGYTYRNLFDRITSSEYYPMDECHWGYLRIYTPENTKLLRSTPKVIPAESTMLGETIPARTDNLGSENIINAQVFGTMVITPTHQTTETEFRMALPVEVLTKDHESNTWAYLLKVQKQPGTLAHPFQLTLHLPAGARIESVATFLEEGGDVWTAQLDLRRDLYIEVRFSLE